jgi:hypothetical protein
MLPQRAGFSCWNPPKRLLLGRAGGVLIPRVVRARLQPCRTVIEPEGVLTPEVSVAWPRQANKSFILDNMSAPNFARLQLRHLLTPLAL